MLHPTIKLTVSRSIKGLNQFHTQRTPAITLEKNRQTDYVYLQKTKIFN